MDDREVGSLGLDPRLRARWALGARWAGSPSSARRLQSALRSCVCCSMRGLSRVRTSLNSHTGGICFTRSFSNDVSVGRSQCAGQALPVLSHGRGQAHFVDMEGTCRADLSAFSTGRGVSRTLCPQQLYTAHPLTAEWRHLY